MLVLNFSFLFQPKTFFKELNLHQLDNTQANVGNDTAAVEDCYWSGEGPICDGKCRPGESAASESHKHNGIYGWVPIDVFIASIKDLFSSFYRKWLHHWHEKVKELNE